MKILHVHEAALHAADAAAGRPLPVPVPVPAGASAGAGCRYRRRPSITPGRLRSCRCLSLAGAVLGLFDERRDIRMQCLQVRFMRIDHVTGGVKMHIDIALKATLNG
jgi:hypothetical protein